MHKGILYISIAITLAFCGVPVKAQIVTVQVEGIVNSVTTSGRFSLDGSVNTSSIMTGYATYDTDSPDIGFGNYAGISITMTIGNYTFTHDSASSMTPIVKVTTTDPGYRIRTEAPKFDGSILVDGSPVSFDNILWNYRELDFLRVLTTQDGYVTSNELPDSFPDISVFDSRKTFSLGFAEPSSVSNRGYFSINGHLTSINVVPEPATLLLLGLAFPFIRNRKR